ncbi:hypothetical protein [Streptomyces sp. CC228A]|uniref:hypothetical protein n=1 Tax=Streptomyces sp. CC228A TaxID=2898186 RepID=UPI001F48075A|nr:hypothetical protein [Streptomyces sp. CC228A]
MTQDSTGAHGDDRRPDGAEGPAAPEPADRPDPSQHPAAPEPTGPSDPRSGPAAAAPAPQGAGGQDRPGPGGYAGHGTYGGPGPHGAYGAPGHGGWAGWTGPPAPPKPGVIPLGPLGLGDVIGGAFTTLWRAWAAFTGFCCSVFGLLLALLGIVVLIGFLTLGATVGDVLILEADDTAFDATPVILLLVVFYLCVLLGSGIAVSLLYAVGPAALRMAVVGGPVRFGMLWRQAWARVWAVLGALVLSWLCAMLPMVAVIAAVAFLGAASDGAPWVWAIGVPAVLGAIALAAWVGVRFSLASSAAVLERLGPVQAMRRSARLVEGAWWRVLGFSVVGWLIAAAVSWVIQTVFQLVAVVPFLVMLPSDSSDVPVAGILVMVALFTVGFALSQIVGSVFPSLVQGLIYIDRRIRTENLAASLAESAGVTLPAPGTAPYTSPYTGPYGPPPAG